MLNLKTEYLCEFAPNIFLKKRRLHQIYGPSRIRMLLFLAKEISGPIFWIKSTSEKIFLHPDGIAPWMNPNRLTFVYAKNQVDTLWTIENIIRDRSSNLIVANLRYQPDFNTIRRLNLKIKQHDTPYRQPICIFFTDSQIDILGTESRWHVRSVPSWNKSKKKCFDLNTESWIFKRIYCRTDPVSQWIITITRKPQTHSEKKFKIQSLKFT